MCGDVADDPSQHDAPQYLRPRAYKLAGERQEPASIALAVLGTMLDEAEDDWRAFENAKAGPTTIAMARVQVDTLRRARNRVADAESRR